jgi:hypothetical protein
MNRVSILAVTTLAGAAFTACETTPQNDLERERANRFGYQGSTGSEYSRTENRADTQSAAQPDVAPIAPEPTPEPEPTVTTPPPVQDPTQKDYQYGTPVPGKPGFVTSPHAPYSGYVDVRGFPPGTEVKDPYTGKIFLVP